MMIIVIDCNLCVIVIAVIITQNYKGVIVVIIVIVFNKRKRVLVHLSFLYHIFSEHL